MRVFNRNESGLLALSFLHNLGRMGARKAALTLMKHSHFLILIGHHSSLPGKIVAFFTKSQGKKVELVGRPAADLFRGQAVAQRALGAGVNEADGDCSLAIPDLVSHHSAAGQDRALHFGLSAPTKGG